LIDRHASYLYGVARSLTPDDHEADDLVQETFVASLTAKFRAESSVRTWLVAILVNRSAMRRRSSRRMTIGLPDDTTPPAPATSEPIKSDATLDLAQMLETLSPEHREVLVLRELQGMTYQEIALTLSIPRGTVESRLHRAREQLKRRFEGYLDDV
jgi:RNA polymerase sigma-70 factor (ECF subfamily)